MNYLNKISFIILFLLVFVSITIVYYSKLIISISQYSSSLILLETIQNDSLYEYKLIHNSILNGKSSIKISVNHYCNAGYANRLYSMLTSLVIALLTDSAFLVRWRYIDLHINEPFFKTFHDFDIDLKRENVFKPVSKFAWSLKRNMDELANTYIPTNFSIYFYSSNEAYFFEICSNPQYYDKLFKYGLVNNQTIQKAFQVKYNMSNYSDKEKQDYILKVPFEVGGNLLNKIWIPNDRIKSLINNYLNYEFNGYFMIGIQLRYQYINLQETYAFIKCAIQIESDLERDNKDFYSLYKGVKWYVSSDIQLALNILKKKYPNKVIIGRGRGGHIATNPDAYSRAILDIELLSKCDELIMTGGSTFGFVAAMKMLKLPYHINGRMNMTKCIRTSLSSPSFTSYNRFAVF